MPKITNEIIIDKAHELGFDLIGFAPAEKLTREIILLKNWLKENRQAGMEYMEHGLDKREDVSLVLPGAKSVISFGVNYYTPYNHENKPDAGKISRYAWGKDYHFLMWEMLKQLEDYLRSLDPSFDAKSYVDTGPVMDRVWAEKASLGWEGKNGNVISKKFGSWIFLATMITNFEFDYNLPAANSCGTCTACINACPTEAIISEGVIDSNKCISYLTIENKGEIPQQFNGKFNGWLFGCDICQDVCPWNKKFAKETEKSWFKPLRGTELPLDMFEELSNRQFNRLFEDSPIKRARAKGMRRNAEFLKKENVKPKE